MQASLITVKISRRRFHNSGNLLKLVQACLSAGNDPKRRLNHCGSLLKLVQACLVTVIVCKRAWFQQPWKSSEARAGLFMHRESL